MKKKIVIACIVTMFLVSCNKNTKLIHALESYNASMEQTGYHFGEKISFPVEVMNSVKTIRVSFGDKETSDLVIDPRFFTLGDNMVTFIIKTKSGETLNQDAKINVFAKNSERNIPYKIIAEYPHNPKNFTQGLQMEGNVIYESDGLEGFSQLIKYTLGESTPMMVTKQAQGVFSEGCTIVGDHIYQLTWKNKKGFIYNKDSLALLAEFNYPEVMEEGWGLTYDGRNLIASDGSKNIYFLEVKNPTKIIRSISVAGGSGVYDKINELEHHDGYLYANIWHKPIVLKINPVNGEVIGKFDFTKITNENTKENGEKILNGIAFKGNNMLITGKNWSKIYEVIIE
ncbi:glutamine cyclotransferase [Chryseobacterium nematophagum]|uniref:Glutamine cyclotransferase n=1 Tax=Chryseobacterium nematophagum TaxID=2305228 RepID=A0A3M7TGS9_9FLAO|nr:glutaminyl-peptide cyclotransferase [Chryseobacterium nematophagum]RNA62731.1 glutamine cyclotransferase [Chryseobacterium nematophagum]